MPFDENEKEPLTSPDTENETLINPDEGTAPSQDPYLYDRLSRINTGAADSFGNRDEVTARTQERLVAWDVVSGDNGLQLTPYQKREGRRLMEDLDTERLGGHLHVAAFCVASYVVSEDDRSSRAYHPRRADRNNDDLFLDTFSELGFSKDRIHGYLNRVERQLP